MAMRFPFLPDRINYSIAPLSSTLVTNQLEGGASSRRKDLDTVALKISAQYTFTPKKYAAFISFYEQWLQDIDSRGLLQPFDILLLYQPTNPEYPLQNFRCSFSTDPVTTTQPEGTGIIVQCTFIGYEYQPYPQSTLYPVMQSDGVQIFQLVESNVGGWYIPADKAAQISGLSLTYGNLSVYKTDYTTLPIEPAAQISGFSLTSGTLTVYKTDYVTLPAEPAAQINGLSLVSGILTVYGTIFYTTPPELAAQIGGLSIISGSLV
jgi:hypothetical protein